MKYIPTIITVLLLVLPLPSCLPSDADIEWDILNQEAVDLYAKGQYGRAALQAGAGDSREGAGTRPS